MSFFQYILFTLSVLTAENVFFARALDTGRLRDFIKSPQNIIKLGTSLVYMNVFAALISFPVAYFMPHSGLVSLLHSVIFLAAAYIGYIVLFIVNVRYKFNLTLPPAVCVNAIVLSTMIICFKEHYSLLQTLIYAAAAAVGYMASMLLVYLGTIRLAYCDSPKAFRGFPILLVYIGLISLALYGLLGHQLPV